MFAQSRRAAVSNRQTGAPAFQPDASRAERYRSAHVLPLFVLCLGVVLTPMWGFLLTWELVATLAIVVSAWH